MRAWMRDRRCISRVVLSAVSLCAASCTRQVSFPPTTLVLPFLADARLLRRLQCRHGHVPTIQPARRPLQGCIRLPRQDDPHGGFPGAVQGFPASPGQDLTAHDLDPLARGADQQAHPETRGSCAAGGGVIESTTGESWRRKMGKVDTMGSGNSLREGFRHVGSGLEI